MENLRKYFKGDPVIWAIIIGLCVVSLLAVYSSAGTLAYGKSGGDAASQIIGHGWKLCGALVIILILHRLPYKIYARLSMWILVIVAISLIFTLFNGLEENEANRRLPFFGGKSFQPSDIAKLGMVIFLADRLAKMHKRGLINSFYKTLLPLFGATVLVCLFIMPANLSTAILLFLTCVVLLCIGKVSLSQLSGLFAATLVVGVLLICGLYGLQKAGVENKVTKRASTWVGRVDRFFSEENTKGDLAENFQANQAKIAVGTSGIIGKGPGNSVQRNFLPHPYSDFIYAIIIEEWGILGGIVVLFLYLNLLFRTVLIVRKCENVFPALLATGLALNVVFQAMMHMWVSVGLMPVTGQTLPFVSMGGSSLWTTGAAFGIILSISRELREKEKLKEAKEIEEKMMTASVVTEQAPA